MVCRRARAQRHDRRVGAFLKIVYEAMEGGSPRNTVPGEFGEWFDGGSLSNRGMYLSPWTGAKYLWAVAETVGGLNGYRTSGRPHLAPLRPKDWTWVAAARVHWGGRRCTYVIDLAGDTIYADMPELSAEEPFTCIYAGRDVSDEVMTSPVEVCAVALKMRTTPCGFSGQHARHAPRRSSRVSRRHGARRDGARRVAGSSPRRQASRPQSPRRAARRPQESGASLAGVGRR